MKWLVRDYLATQGRRLAGQGAAVAVGYGMAAELEQPLAVAGAWVLATVAEYGFSKRSRKKLVASALEMWGRN